MISNQILQSTLDGLKAIARVELCVIDVDGKTAATTADGLEEYLPQARAFVDSADGTRVFQETEAAAAPTIRELHEQYKPIVLAAVT